MKMPYKDPEKRRAYWKAYDAARAEKRRKPRKPAKGRNTNTQLTRQRKWRGLPEPLRPEPPACECCGRPPKVPRKHLCLDHDHRTGQFRGWLCNTCNIAIGKLGDGLAGVVRAVAYLRRAAQ
jgi:hypothetical protein